MRVLSAPAALAALALTTWVALPFSSARPVAAEVSAETLTMELNKASPAFAGYYWEAFRFDGPVKDGGMIALRSSDFDSYLFVITPDGSVLTNDDHSLPIEKLAAGDAGLALTFGGEGTWFAVATAYSPGQGGSFEILAKGLPPLQPTGLIEDETLATAFEARGIIDPEIARQQAVAAVAERLSLASFRAELEETFRAEIVRVEQDQASARQSLATAEIEEAELAAALEAIETLPSHRDLVRSLIQEGLNSAQTDVEYSAKAAFEALGHIDAFRAALEDLAELDRLATRIEQIEAALLDAITSSPSDLERLGQELIEDRTAFASAAAELAERLQGMGILDQVRFSQIGTATHVDMAEIQTDAAMGGTNSIIRDPGERVFGGFWGGGNWTAAPAPDAAFAPDADPPEVSLEVDPTVLMPELFPWPPPEASARAIISRELFGAASPGTLGAVADILAEALAEAGYTGPGYLGVPGGFAMITRIEQTDRGGRPLAGNARWATKIVVVKSFSISAVIRALMTAEPGFFRVMALVVTDKSFDDNGSRARLETLENWSRKGVDALVPDVRDMPFGENYKISALVYEFEKFSESEDPVVRIPSINEVRGHLTHTRFARFIQ